MEIFDTHFDKYQNQGLNMSHRKKLKNKEGFRKINTLIVNELSRLVRSSASEVLTLINKLIPDLALKTGGM